MLTARVIGSDDFAAVDALRIASYRRATWFTLKDAERIRCERDLPRSRVTAVFDGAAPVATICQTLMFDAAEAAQVLEMDAKVADEDFPALVISRAATAEGCAGLRLNHVLRWYSLHAATTDGIRSILAGHARGTPNLRVMAELGYRFVDAEVSTMSQVEINTGHVMSYLPASGFATALVRLSGLLVEALPQIAWVGRPLAFAEWLPARRPQRV
jgi:hypothetical protein